jgi:hypothetical protein
VEWRIGDILNIYIDRRVFIGLSAAILFGAPSRAFSQRLAKLPRIGVLQTVPARNVPPRSPCASERLMGYLLVVVVCRLR